MKPERLKMIIVGLNESRSEDTLHQHHLERCEFCDKIFSSRYAMLKHNASHIIIPLIKLTTHQCDECLYHFTSVEDLALHTANKHKNTQVPVPPVDIKLEEDFNEKIPDILQSIVEKQVIVKCGDDLKEVISKCDALKNKNGTKLHENRVDSIELIKEEPIIKIEEHSSSSDGMSSPTNEEQVSTRQRILFEEDIEDNVLKDLSADCQVGLETLYDKINLGFNKPIKMTSSDVMTLLKPIGYEGRNGEIISRLHNDTTETLRYEKAIHYDVLMAPEVCSCRWCGQHFPNRYELIKHEPKHLKIIKTQKNWPWPLCCVCERYISGNYRTLRIHMEIKHPDKLETNFHIQKCPKCSYRFHNFTKHLRHYHEWYRCTKCSQGFETIQLRSDHKCGRVDTHKYIQFATPSNLTNRTSTDIYKTSTDMFKTSTDIFKTSTDMFKTSTDIYKTSTDPTYVSTDTYKSACYQESFESMVDSAKLTIMPQDRQETSVMKLCEMCFSFMKISQQNRQNFKVIGEKTELGVRQVCDKCNQKFFEVKLVKRKHFPKYPDFDFPKKLKGSSDTNSKRLKKIQSRLRMLKNRNKY